MQASSEKWRHRLQALELHSGTYLPPEHVRHVLQQVRYDFQHVLHTDLPAVFDETWLKTWFHNAFEEQVQRYTTTKHIPMFEHKAQLLVYLLMIAPTKLVDGIWLKSVPTWQWDTCDKRIVKGLLKDIYEEELGSGIPEDNHVYVYQMLLRDMGFSDLRSTSDELDFLDDTLFAEAVVQSLFGLAPQEFAPEILGYTLGYEMLNANILKLRDECRKHRVNDRYFALHIAIDNHHCGHAKEAFDAVVWYMRQQTQEALTNTWHRIRFGHSLNAIGVAPRWNVIEEHLKKVTVKRFSEKSHVGAHLHRRERTNQALQTMEDTDQVLHSLSQMNLDVLLGMCDTRMPCVFTELDKELLKWTQKTQTDQ